MMKNTRIHHSVHKFLLWPFHSEQVIQSFVASPSAVTHPEHACTHTHAPRRPWQRFSTGTSQRECMRGHSHPGRSFTVSISARLPRSCVWPTVMGADLPVQLRVTGGLRLAACPGLGSCLPLFCFFFHSSIFFFFLNTLKHDLLWILTCDKLYTLLIVCQLDRWSCAFQWGAAVSVGVRKLNFLTFPRFPDLMSWIPPNLTCSTLSSPSSLSTVRPYSTVLYFYPCHSPTLCWSSLDFPAVAHSTLLFPALALPLLFS